MLPNLTLLVKYLSSIFKNYPEDIRALYSINTKLCRGDISSLAITGTERLDVLYAMFIYPNYTSRNDPQSCLIDND